MSGRRLASALLCMTVSHLRPLPFLTPERQPCLCLDLSLSSYRRLTQPSPCHSGGIGNFSFSDTFIQIFTEQPQGKPPLGFQEETG